MIRASLALSLVISILAAPLVMDQCAASCERTDAHKAANAPTCHHATAPAAHIGRTPERCGHDHTSASAVGVADATRPTRLSGWTVIVEIPAPFVVVDAAGSHRVESDSSPPAGPSQHALISPLRI